MYSILLWRSYLKLLLNSGIAEIANKNYLIQFSIIISFIPLDFALLDKWKPIQFLSSVQCCTLQNRAAEGASAPNKTGPETPLEKHESDPDLERKKLEGVRRKVVSVPLS